MMREAYANPTLNSFVSIEIRRNPCKCCKQGRQLMGETFICKENLEYPRCRNHSKGFVYDEGE